MMPKRRMKFMKNLLKNKKQNFNLSIIKNNGGIRNEKGGFNVHLQLFLSQHEKY